MLLGHLNALSHEVPVPVFCPLICRSLLFIKDTSSFSDVSVVNIFSPSLWLSFSLLFGGF